MPLRDYLHFFSVPLKESPLRLSDEAVLPAISRSDVVNFCVKLAASALMAYVSVKIMTRYLDPTYAEKEKAKKMVAEARKRLRLHPSLQMSDNETIICTMMVGPEDGVNHWSRIGGCRSILTELENRVLTPLRLISSGLLPSSSLFTPPKGVLLHGPPGCGKTLIAKAIAQASGAKFILFDPAVLSDKWFGESQKLVRALFSLAKKIQPCIIFVDEIDSFLRTRSSMDHEVNSQMKTQFMCLWDGFATSDDNIIILGATNRPQDLDPAIVRRLPLRFEVPLPGETDRADILRIILSEEGVTDGIDYAKIAKGMRGMSGSDIKEVCRSAALSSLQRALNEMNAGAGIQHPEITEADLTDAVTKSTPVPKGLPSLSTIPSHILLD